jgi:hypothetical protein
VDLFVALETVISDYPSPPSLQDALLVHLYDVLGRTLPRNPRSMELRAQRYLKQSGQPKHGVQLVEGLRQANEEMLRVIGDEVEESLSSSYARFVEHWYSKVEDDHLVSTPGNARASEWGNNAAMNRETILSHHSRASFNAKRRHHHCLRLISSC